MFFSFKFKTDLPESEFITPYAQALTEPEWFEAKPLYELTKRGLETLLALFILVVFSPLWLLVALAIKLGSPGPVLYRGQVVGKNGREFTYYKFRSMYHNNDNTLHRLFIQHYVNQTAIEFKLTNDRRVTKAGKLLRKLSLDEIPQLLNVIRGEMAIVGPRPPLVYEYELYDATAHQRLAVLPGITGLAQVQARGKASFQQMFELDLEYIEKRSLWLDLKIMLKTPIVMLEGA
jgi:lipopolysaccharide/colanic/teichoic acid biosynthesis glycosyltransferase